MKTKRHWKSGNRLDGILNVLLILLALSVLGVGALEAETNVKYAASSGQQRI